MKLLIITLSCLFIYSSGYSQSSKFYHHEIGIDITGLLVEWTDNNLKSNRAEIIYRTRMKKGDIRFKIYRERQEITDGEAFINYVPLSDFCIDKQGYYNTLRPIKKYGFLMGYAHKYKIKNLKFYAGLDFKLQVNQSLIHTSLRSCRTDSAGEQQIGQQLHRTTDNNTYTIGGVPFVGFKIPVSKRIILNLELGVQFNNTYGKRLYLNEMGQYSSLPVKFFEINKKKIINDLAILYLF